MSRLAQLENAMQHISRKIKHYVYH